MQADIYANVEQLAGLQVTHSLFLFASHTISQSVGWLVGWLVGYFIGQLVYGSRGRHGVA